MKALLTYALFFALAMAAQGAAQGKPAPFELRALALSANDTTIDSGPSGASLESNYFRAPQPPVAAGRVFPCRLQLRMFDTMRLAQNCN